MDKNSKISKILDVEKDLFDGFSEVIEFDDIVNFKFNSIDVKRSFSIYKNTLSDFRPKSFKLKNISKIIFEQCNPNT